MQNFSVLKLISLLHTHSPAASWICKTSNDFHWGLKKLEKSTACLKAAEVNGRFIEMDLRAWHCQVRSGLSSVMQTHGAEVGRYFGELQCHPCTLVSAEV